MNSPLAAGSLRFLAANRQTFHFEHRIRYAECTVGNHVYYGRYLEILEEARGEFFRSLGRTLLQWQEADLIFPVIEVRVRYKASARYDDKVPDKGQQNKSQAGGPG